MGINIFNIKLFHLVMVKDKNEFWKKVVLKRKV